MGVYLQPAAVRIIHQDQGDAVVGRRVAERDVLPFAAAVGEGQRLVVEQVQKTARPAAMLDIGPTGLRQARHIEAVAFGDELGFGIAEAVEGAFAFEVLEIPRAALRLLRRLHRGRAGDIHKSVGHGADSKAWLSI